MRFISQILLVALLVLPLSANAATQAELEAQAQALINQIQALQAQVAAGQPINTSTTVAAAPSTGGTCPQLGQSLKYGMTSPDVTRLQTFLAADPSVYPEGIVSGYFGALTQAAVQRWQTKFHIVSAGTPATTGYGVVGPRTAAAIAIICSGGSVNGVSGPAAGSNSAIPTVGGFIQVSPISGNAALTVNIQATINTTNSCNAAIYTLDYGDGSNPQLIPSSSGVCTSQTIPLSHLYTNPGTYIIRLYAGDHSTSATITVFGTGQAPPQTNTVSSTANVKIADNTFTASAITIAPGTTVNWNNAGTMAHTVTADNGTFDSGTIAPGQNFALKFPAAGIYKYYCKFHGAQNGVGMSGIVSVVDPNAPVSTPTTPTTPATTTPALGPLAVTPNLSNRSVQAQFNLPGCPAYTLNWGDGSTPAGENSATCNSNGDGNNLMSLTHSYTTIGSYTITLVRGTQSDSAAVTFQ